jgi:hypothetical protein
MGRLRNRLFATLGMNSRIDPLHHAALIGDRYRPFSAPDQKKNSPIFKKRVMIVCTHLRQGRTKKRARMFMQPLAGLHIASLLGKEHFEVSLHHEDWHGPYDTRGACGYDLVFLTGLQADFDRMRQLSYHFRRRGAVVVAGGSICTLFPQFAAEYFDAICAGSVDTVPELASDFLKGSMKRIYRSQTGRRPSYVVDYSIFTRSGINPTSHLVEASRGCSFRCSFCVLPAEKAGHVPFQIEAVHQAIRSAVKTSPLWTFRRLYPTLFFLDNNFSDSREHMLAVCDFMKNTRMIRRWGAMVTQNTIHDRDLVRQLARSKCRMLFIGLESLDREFLQRYNKKQNLSRKYSVIDDVLFAERCGVCVSYGYLFDPRSTNVTEMEAQVAALAQIPGFPMPTYFSLIAPLVGTAAFWDDVANGDLAANLRLRDLEGETIAYAKLKDQVERVADFAGRIAHRPWTIVSHKQILYSTFRRIMNSRRIDPMHWYVAASANLHSYFWANSTPSARKTYLAGEDVLDPQYDEYPSDMETADWIKYFKPIQVTGPDGELAEWLAPFRPEKSTPNAVSVS